MRHAVTSQAQLVHGAVPQQPRVRRSVRRMTGRAPFGLDRRVLEGKRSLLINVALDAGCIGATGEPGLFGFEASVRVVTIAATHRAFQHFVMERHIELRLDFVMTAGAKLRIVRLQHSNR